jgi:hypothetical protein
MARTMAIIGHQGVEEVRLGPTRGHLPPKLDPIDPTVIRPPRDLADDEVSTDDWGAYALRKEYPPGAWHQLLYADVSLTALPAKVRERLLAFDPGLAAWLDDPEGEVLSWRAEIVGTHEAGDDTVRTTSLKYGPPRRLKLADLAAKVRGDGETPAERRERRRAEADARDEQDARARAEKRAEQEAKLAAEKRRLAAEDEAHRRKNPAYCLDLVERETARQEELKRQMEEIAGKVLAANQP